MGHVIHLHGGRHEEATLLLSWFVTGQLDAADHARVEAHLAHCAECQADVAVERKLNAAVADMSLDVERGWAGLRQRVLDDGGGRRRTTAMPAALGRMFARPGRVGWLVAAQVGFVVALAAVLSPTGEPAPYQALSSADEPVAGNVIVVFSPDLRERDMRRVLRASNARLVEGPTMADAYVLSVPAVERSAALATLRAETGVVLAQPVDRAATR